MTLPDRDFAGQRRQLVDDLRRRGIRDENVLNAMASVPREQFVSPELRDSAYRDCALPIDNDQTISQPFIVALMAEALKLRADDRVLDIGTGSGYAAAVMASIAGDVYSVERHSELAAQARTRLRELSFGNAHVRHGDGTQGWPEFAPFDAISVAACSPQVPPELLRQLRVGGRLVIPVGRQNAPQTLVLLRKVSDEEYDQAELSGVRFVPLVTC